MSSAKTCVICGGGNGRLEKLGPNGIKTLVDSSLCKNDGLHSQLQVAVSVSIHRNCCISYSSNSSSFLSSDQFNALETVSSMSSLPVDEVVVESPFSLSAERELEDDVIDGIRRQMTENGLMEGSAHSIANAVVSLLLPETLTLSSVLPTDEKSWKQTTGVRQTNLPNASLTADESCHTKAIDGTVASCGPCSQQSQRPCSQKENNSNCVQSRSGNQFAGLKRSGEPETIDIETRLADSVVTPAVDVTEQNSSSADIVDGMIAYLLAAGRRLTDVVMVERELRKRLATMAESEINCYIMYMARAAQYFMPRQISAMSDLSVAAANSNSWSAAPVYISAVNEVERCPRTGDEKENSLVIKSEAPDNVSVSDHQMQFKSELSDCEPMSVQSSFIHAGGTEELDSSRGTTLKRSLDTRCAEGIKFSKANSNAFGMEGIGNAYSTPGQLAQSSEENFEFDVSHSNEKQTSNYSCDADATFSSESTCRHVGEKQFDCNIFGAIFARTDSLTVDSRRPAGEKPFNCDICGLSFVASNKLMAHKRCHTGQKPFHCNICGSSFTRADGLRTHERRHNGEKPFKCDICGSSFVSSSALNDHKRRHVGEKSYKCSMCKSSFRELEALQAHKLSHTGEDSFKCDICDSLFTSSSNLMAHKRCHIGEKQFHCTICGSIFARADSLRVHKRRHTGEKPFKCDICGSSFVSSSALCDHKRCHSDEKPFKCNVCGASFAWPSGYRRHMRLHTGEKPYTCSMCGFSFACSSGFRRHMRRHSAGEEKAPHKCDLCELTFASVEARLVHERGHCPDDEKPLKCEIRGLSFTQSCNLSVHRHRHTSGGGGGSSSSGGGSGAKTVKCKMFGLSYAWPSSYRTHPRPLTGGKVVKIRKRVAVAKSNGKVTPRAVVRKPSRLFYNDERRDQTDDYFSCATREETENKAPAQKLVSRAESGDSNLHLFLAEGNEAAVNLVKSECFS